MYSLNPFVINKCCFLLLHLKNTIYALNFLKLFHRKKRVWFQFNFVPFLLVLLIEGFLLTSPITAADRVEDLRQKIMEEGLIRSLVAIRQLIPIGVNPDCFISHICMPEDHPDTLWSNRIESYLRSVGVRTIYDYRNLSGADDIRAFINQITTANFVMSLFSPSYKENYERMPPTWIREEAELIRARLAAERVSGVGNGFHIPVLLVGHHAASIPPEFVSSDILHYPLTKGEAERYQTDWSECFEFIFRVLKEKIYRNLFGIGMAREGSFDEIKRRYDYRKGRVPNELFPRNFHSLTGFFPQSLIAHNAFLDRSDKTGLSYLDRIFEELFINEDRVSGYSTTTLCASGMGGVGKTTLAIEYTHKYGPFYELVYWLNGSSKGDLLRSYLSLLELLKLPIPDRSTYEEEAYYAEVIKLINTYVPGHSLLVIDNIEEPELVQYIRPKGHILYTSRNNDWLKRIDVDVLKRDESVKLLLQLTGLDPSLSAQADTLAEELGDLPLALAQAAAYIKQQPLASFIEYLEHYRESQADLLARRQIQASLNKREAVVMTTWNTTMQRLSPQSQQLMNYFAYLAPSGIPSSWFKSHEDSLDLIKELAAYSMIRFNEGQEEISIHALVQAVSMLGLEQKESMNITYLKDMLKIICTFWLSFESLYEDDFDSPRPLDHYKINSCMIPHLEKLYSHLQRIFKKDYGCLAVTAFRDQLVNLKVSCLSLQDLTEDLLESIRSNLFRKKKYEESETVSSDEEEKREKEHLLSLTAFKDVLKSEGIEIKESFIPVVFSVFCELIGEELTEEKERLSSKVELAIALAKFEPSDISILLSEIRPFLADITSSHDRIKLSKIFTKVEAGNLKKFSDLLRSLLPSSADSLDIIQISEALVEIPSHEWEILLAEVGCLLSSSLNGYQIGLIINKVYEHPHRREYVASLYKIVSSMEMDGYQQAKIIEAFSEIEISRHESLFKLSKPFLRGDMDGSMWEHIIIALSNIELSNAAMFHNNFVQLLSEDIEAQDYISILETLVSLNTLEWQEFSQIALTLLPICTNSPQKSEIIYALSLVNHAARRGYSEKIRLLSKTVTDHRIYGPIALILAEEDIPQLEDFIGQVTVISQLLPLEEDESGFRELAQTFSKVSTECRSQVVSVIQRLYTLDMDIFSLEAMVGTFTGLSSLETTELADMTLSLVPSENCISRIKVSRNLKQLEKTFRMQVVAKAENLLKLETEEWLAKVVDLYIKRKRMENFVNIMESSLM